MVAYRRLHLRLAARRHPALHHLARTRFVQRSCITDHRHSVDPYRIDNRADADPA